MITKVIYAALSATADNAASLDIPTSTKLVAVQWAVNFDSVTDNSRLEIELSTAAASQFATNNVNDVISVVAASLNLATSGLALWGINQQHSVSVDLKAQQRIALHCVLSGTITARCYAVLWFTR